MTMTLSFSPRFLRGIPTEGLFDAVRPVGMFCERPYVQIVVSGAYWDNGKHYDRWPIELGVSAAQNLKSAALTERILRVDNRGESRWLSGAEAEPIFEDIAKIGYMSFPNAVAGEDFHFLRELSLPLPLRGSWTKHPTGEYRHQLDLPGTPFDKKRFTAHLYVLLLLGGRFSGEHWEPCIRVSREFYEEAGACGQAARAFFQTAQRHMLITDFA